MEALMSMEMRPKVSTLEGARQDLGRGYSRPVGGSRRPECDGGNRSTDDYNPSCYAKFERSPSLNRHQGRLRSWQSQLFELMSVSDTPVMRQIAWVLECIKSESETDINEIEEHFAPAFLRAITAERVQEFFRDLSVRGVESLEIQDDPSSPYALRGTAIVGPDRLLIGAQTESDEPYRLFTFLLRPEWSIQQIFADTARSTAPLDAILGENIGSLIENLPRGGSLVGVVSGQETHIGRFGLGLYRSDFRDWISDQALNWNLARGDGKARGGRPRGPCSPLFP